ENVQGGSINLRLRNAGDTQEGLPIRKPRGRPRKEQSTGPGHSGSYIPLGEHPSGERPSGDQPLGEQPKEPSGGKPSGKPQDAAKEQAPRQGVVGERNRPKKSKATKKAAKKAKEPKPQLGQDPPKAQTRKLVGVVIPKRPRSDTEEETDNPLAKHQRIAFAF